MMYMYVINVCHVPIMTIILQNSFTILKKSLCSTYLCLPLLASQPFRTINFLIVWFYLFQNIMQLEYTFFHLAIFNSD